MQVMLIFEYCEHAHIICPSLSALCSPHFCFEDKGAITAEDVRAYTMKDIDSKTPRLKDIDASERFFESETTHPSPTSSAVPELAFTKNKKSKVRWMDIHEQIGYREYVRTMFIHAYDSYMKYAFPLGELRPLSCTGGQFDLIKINMVTLIDTLDTLIVMGNYSEFRIAAHIVTTYMPSFDIDANVSVFETNIRILGGLLSAHLLAIDEDLDVYAGQEKYDFGLLRLAQDLGDRLLPAFDSPTGIPYGTVNLRHGVPPMESEVASTAGAGNSDSCWQLLYDFKHLKSIYVNLLSGSLIIELEVLSTLTGNNKYGDAALRAALAIYEHRGSSALVGKHININSGRWHETASGIGSNADSFYEYLFKASQLFRSDSLFTRFSDMFIAVKKQLQVGDWFSELDIGNNKYRRCRFESLQAFWPGMEANMGLAESSARLLNTFYAVWVDYGFLPEDTDWSKLYTTDADLSAQYPLRPELIESTYHQYRYEDVCIISNIFIIILNLSFNLKLEQLVTRLGFYLVFRFSSP
jgi:ER degradation enhancer, mannosidase alpha-like 2